MKKNNGIFTIFPEYFNEDDDQEKHLSLEFTKLFNSRILNDLQTNIKNYAQSHIKNFKPSQDYTQLRKNYSRNRLFVDQEFLPENASVFYSNTFRNFLSTHKRLSPSGNVIWKRIKDIRPAAQLAGNLNGRNINSLTEEKLKECFNRADQGHIGNCWFIAAVSGIIENLDLFKKIVPFDNCFVDEEYCGMFHFRFWIYGTWYDVVIDDFLPVGQDGKLNFCHNKSNLNDFWCALLEKAYAKINGSYEALDGGHTSDALLNMSGGLGEKYDLKKLFKTRSDESMIENFWSILKQAQKKRSVICCDIDGDLTKKGLNENRVLDNGLVVGHAYIITTLVSIRVENEKIRLVNCRNPWGKSCEFKGEWSRRSPVWSILSDRCRSYLLEKVKDKGKFW